jgi:hypothetical protein
MRYHIAKSWCRQADCKSLCYNNSEARLGIRIRDNITDSACLAPARSRDLLHFSVKNAYLA